MAVTTEHYYTGNASTTSFPYTFPYYKTSDIKVTWDGVLKTESSHYNVTGTNIVFTSGNVPANNVVIRIYRDTDVDTSKATFAAGSSIRATDLNNNELQLLYHAQEQQSSGRVNANISAKAEIDVNKLKDGTARQLIQTDAAGTGVEWTSNIDVPGTLDVTGATTLDSNLGVTGNITVSGTVDGRNVSTDGTKLDGIEAGAKGDQTAAEIKSAYEGVSNTNAYTDAEKTKLAGIATDSNNYSISSDLLDEDNMASNSATKAASQQSIKAYVDANAGGGGDANQNAFSNVAVSGQTTVAADTTTDTLTLAGGSNVTITTNDSTDTVTIAASGGEVTVQDEGSALSTAATTLNFVGAGVTASGSGATKTITISGSGGSAITTDYQYLELKALDNPNGAFSAGSSGYELVTKGTSTAVSPDQAAAMLVSIAGVLQEPNTGTSIGSNDGFCIDGSSIHFGSTLTAHPDFIIWMKGSGSHAIDDDSVTEVKLDISNTASDGQFLQYKDSSDKLTWASVTGTPEGTAVKSTGESGTTKFLRVDGDGSCSWQVPPDTDTNTQLTEAQVEAFVGGMVTGNTETGITVTYENSDGTLDFVVASQTDENFTTADHSKLDGIATGATATPTTTRGDVIYRGASADERLAKGTAGQYLKQGANDPEWADVVGAVANGCIFENDDEITDDYTIASDKRGHSVGPLTVSATVTVNGVWVIS